MREIYIDIAKSLGIILVVIGHTKISGDVITYIYSFHMPLFIVLVGYVFSKTINKNPTIQSFAIDNFLGLIKPYIYACIFFYLFWLILGRNYGEYSILHVSFLTPIIGIVYGNGHDQWLIFNAVLWFLPFLFSAKVIFYRLILYEINNKFYINQIRILMVIICGFIVSKFFFMPWGLDIAMISQLFIILGYYLKKKDWLEKRDKNIHVIIILICIFTTYVCVTYNGRVDMSSRQYNNLFLFYLGGVSGSLLVLHIAYLLKDKIISSNLSYIGRNSLVIMIFHPLAFKIVSFIGTFVLHLSLNEFQKSYWIIYALFGVLLPIIGYKACKELNFLSIKN